MHDYIKRVIGVPGDHVACCNRLGQVTVNGVPLSEKSYLYPGDAPSEQRFSIIVPPGRLWVMGDHRSVSWDSRGHMSDPGNGTIPENHVVGRAFVIVAPISRWRILPIPATFQQPKLTASGAAALAVDPALGGLQALRTPARPCWARWRCLARPRRPEWSPPCRSPCWNAAFAVGSAGGSAAPARPDAGTPPGPRALAPRTGGPGRGPG